jgi:hypothetical protein
MTVKNWGTFQQILSATNYTWTCPRLNSATNTIRMTALSVSSTVFHTDLSSFRILSHRPCEFSRSFYTMPHTTIFSNGFVITQMMTTHTQNPSPGQTAEPQVRGQDHQQIMTNFALNFAVHIGLHNVDYKRRFLNPGVLSERSNSVRLPSLRT